MNDTILTTDQLIKASEILKAMSHPIRISILYLLKDGEKYTVSQIQDFLEVEQSTTSHHLGILKSQGIVCSKREGKNIFYYSRILLIGEMLDCIVNCSCK